MKVAESGQGVKRTKLKMKVKQEQWQSEIRTGCFVVRMHRSDVQVQTLH